MMSQSLVLVVGTVLQDFAWFLSADQLLVTIAMPRSFSSGRCRWYAGRAGFSGSGCGSSRRDPTFAAR